MNHIYIYGAPGTGKSTLAQAVAKTINCRFVELDAVRPLAQSKVTRSQEPFLFEYTTEAWKRFGPLNSENVVRGLISIRRAFEPFVGQDLAQYKEDTIAEAVFVEPYKSAVLIINPDAESHYNNFFVHRQRSKDADLQFQAARLMQDFLIQEATEKGLTVVENNGAIDYSVAKVLPIVKKLLR